MRYVFIDVALIKAVAHCCSHNQLSLSQHLALSLSTALSRAICTPIRSLSCTATKTNSKKRHSKRSRGQNNVCTANFAVYALSLSLSLSLLVKQPAVCVDLFVLFRVLVRQVFGIDSQDL